MKRFLLLFLIAIQFVYAQQPRIYYIDYSETINSVALNGGDHKVIQTSFNTPVFISFYNDKLYVSDNNSVNRNYRFNPDGTLGEIVHDEVSGAIKPSSVSGNNNELYFIDRDYIRKSDLDGNNVVDLIPFTTTQSKVQVVGDKIYWNGGSAIRSANLDGTNAIALNDNATTFRGFWIEGNDAYYIADSNIIKSPVSDFSNATVLISSSSPNLSSPIDVTVFEGKLYYTDTGLDKIMRCNLDGSNIEEVYDIPGLTANPIGIAGYNGYIYWSDSNKKTVNRISTNLTNFEVVLGDEFSSVRDLALTEDELVFTSSYIKKSAPEGTMVTTLTASTDFTDETRVSGDEIFFSDQTAGIMKTAINTYNPQAIVGIQTSDFINSFAIGGDFIYWIENENNTGTVYKSFIDGTNVQSIYTDAVPLYNIEFYEERVYFTRNFDQNNLYSVDTSGANGQSAFSVNGAMNNFVIHNGVVYFGWSRENGAFALVSANIDATNAQVIKELPAPLTDMDIYEPAIMFHPDDYNALLALYNSTDGPNWTNTWDINAPINTFYGVSFDANNRVSVIDLGTNNLVGTLPAEIGNLTNLETLRLPGNQISGNIPQEITNLVNLTTILNLSGNQLTGTIPSGFSNLINLERLFLDNNQLTGGIPSELGSLPSLLTLNLTANQLTGAIPVSLTMLTNLQGLFLESNLLTGSISPDFGNLTDLTFFDVRDNQLTGTLPATFGNLTQLQLLDLALNDFSGSIPPEIGNLMNVFQIDFNGNNFSGTLPTEIGNLTMLTRLFLSNNNFSGTIPASIGNLVNLEQLFFSNNNFSGSIPPEIGNLTNVRFLSFRDNNFEGVIPATFGNLTNLQSVTFASNQLSGSIPTEIANLTNLTAFVINNNKISGIPEIFNVLSNITGLLIHNNDLVFLDIEPIFTQFQGISTFTYAPQNKFGFVETITVDNGDPIALTSLFADIASVNNTYQWFKDNVAVPGATSPTLNFTNASPEDHNGVYELRVTNSIVTDLELVGEPITVNVLDALSVAENSLETTKIYPNPARSFINLEINNSYTGIVDLNLYDISGKLIYNKQEDKFAGNFNTKINTSQLTNGVYILKVKTRTAVITKRVLVSK